MVPSLIVILVFEGIVPLYSYAILPKYNNPLGWLLYQAVPEKTFLPKLVILLGISMEFSLLQPLKAESPIEVTLLGIAMEVSPLQPEKAPLPMLVTLFGISMDLRSIQPENALSPILVMLLGIVEFLHPLIIVFDCVSIIALQLLRESYVLFPPSTDIDVRLLHPLKEPASMLSTLLGITMEIKLLQL